MALAELTLYKYTGTNAASETDTSWTPTFLNTDTTSTDTGSYPVPAPETGYWYSYECWLRMKCTSAPDNKIENILWWYQAVDPATGLKIYVGTNATGVTPTGNSSTQSTIATTDAITKDDVGSALAWGTPQASDQITAIGQYTDYLVTQLRVATTASQGDMPVQVCHVQWDES